MENRSSVLTMDREKAEMTNDKSDGGEEPRVSTQNNSQYVILSKLANPFSSYHSIP